MEGRFEPTPWEGRSLEHAERDGMRIPVTVEVAWVLASGRLPYFRGHITEITYDRASD